VEAGLAPALLPIDPVAPVELVLVTAAAATNPAPWPVAAVVLTVLPGPERVLLVECALGLELAVVAAPVELVALAPEVVEPVLPVTSASAVGPGLPLALVASAAGPGLPLALPVLVDVEGLLALPVGVLLVALDAVVVAGRLPPLRDTVLAWDV
jgi:hypothetical protein